jgi:hypothetical protein
VAAAAVVVVQAEAVVLRRSAHMTTSQGELARGLDNEIN